MTTGPFASGLFGCVGACSQLEVWAAALSSMVLCDSFQARVLRRFYWARHRSEQRGWRPKAGLCNPCLFCPVAFSRQATKLCSLTLIRGQALTP